MTQVKDGILIVKAESLSELTDFIHEERSERIRSQLEACRKSLNGTRIMQIKGINADKLKKTPRLST